MRTTDVYGLIPSPEGEIPKRGCHIKSVAWVGDLPIVALELARLTDNVGVLQPKSQSTSKFNPDSRGHICVHTRSGHPAYDLIVLVWSNLRYIVHPPPSSDDLIRIHHICPSKVVVDGR